MQRIRTIFFQFLFVVFVLEIVLYFYNPLSNRYRNGKLVLPANTSYKIVNTSIAGVDSLIVHTKNSLGFRGSELKNKTDKKIVCIGGSTTECFYLSDGKDWPSLLKLNQSYQILNAGLDGHTTFGHQYLYDNHIKKLKPDLIFILAGANDMFVQKMSKFDLFMLPNKNESLIRKLAKKSEILTILFAVKNAKKAQVVKHKSIDVHQYKARYTDSMTLKKQLLELNSFLTGYNDRLKKLVDDMKRDGVEVILLTQPTLMKGQQGFDASNIDLGMGWNGKRFYASLIEYNNVTRMVAKNLNVKIIDLEKQMDGNPLWFYDQVHFTKLGASKVAAIINNNFD